VRRVLGQLVVYHPNVHGPVSLSRGRGLPHIQDSGWMRGKQTSPPTHLGFDPGGPVSDAGDIGVIARYFDSCLKLRPVEPPPACLETWSSAVSAVIQCTVLSPPPLRNIPGWNRRCRTTIRVMKRGHFAYDSEVGVRRYQAQKELSHRRQIRSPSSLRCSGASRRMALCLLLHKCPHKPGVQPVASRIAMFRPALLPGSAGNMATQGCEYPARTITKATSFLIGCHFKIAYSSPIGHRSCLWTVPFRAQ
jgi:hypothetical protein